MSFDRVVSKYLDELIDASLDLQTKAVLSPELVEKAFHQTFAWSIAAGYAFFVVIRRHTPSGKFADLPGAMDYVGGEKNIVFAG